jgi:hypothetical protein
MSYTFFKHISLSFIASIFAVALSGFGFLSQNFFQKNSNYFSLINSDEINVVLSRFTNRCRKELLFGLLLK